MPVIRIEIRGQSFDAPLPEAPFRIGKSPDADLCIQGEGVGAEHCQLEPLGGGRTKIKDLGSGYETLVNGVAIKQLSLNDGDVVQVGEASITYLANLAGAPSPPEPEAEMIPEAPQAPARPAKAVAPKAPAAPKPPTPKPPKPPVPDAPKADAPAAPQAEAPEAPTTDAPKPDGPRRAKSKVPMVGILAGVVLLIGGFFVLGSMETSTKDTSWSADLAEGERLFEAKDYAAARRKLQRAYDRAPEGDAKVKTADALRRLGSKEREMDGHLERLQGERLDLDKSMLAAERVRFLDVYGDMQAPRFDAAKASILRAQRQWKEENLAATGHVAADHVSRNEFVQARKAWETLGSKAPTAIDVSAEVEEGLSDLTRTTEIKADEIIARASGWNSNAMAYRSVKLFDDVLPSFEGFPAKARLVKARATAVEINSQPLEVPETGPAPTRPPGSKPRHDDPRAGYGKRKPDRPGPVPPDPRPRDPAAGDPEAGDPTPSKPQPTPEDIALAKRADAAAAAAAAEADARRFRDAAAAAAARTFPEGTQRARLEQIAADYGKAASAKQSLVAHIQANPDRYVGVRLAPRLKVALVDADSEYLHAKVTGGLSKHAWSRLPADAWVRLVQRMRPEQDACMPCAALLHVLGRKDEAERMLATAVEKGVDSTEVFATLARWRGIPLPQGGFVLHDGRYMTPSERDHLVQEARIKEALAQLDSNKPEERELGAKTLLEIGQPAAERFQGALERRRAYLVDQIVKSKSYKSGKYKTKLLQLLAERRKHALALIYDAQAYPYPNPQKRNQAEVEARVDRVREVWERPFDLVAQWDKTLQARIAGLTEVDELLAQVVAGYQPSLDELKVRINAAIDVPGAADAGKREYSLKVLVYNETLDTTAGVQEKANVKSVNDYRMMMGLLAVKIDEKLVRAARGHSRHMATNGYFAHNVPAPYATPTNRTPGVRAKQQGFGGGVGENIARGPSTGHGAFMAWFRSSGHHRNMLGRGWLVLGCGRASQTWWTQKFGGGSKSLTPPDALPPPAAPFAPDPVDKKDKPRGAGDAESSPDK